MLLVLVAFSALLWLSLLLARDRAYTYAENLALADMAKTPPLADECPTVTAIIPARNEEEMLPHTLPTLLRQEYPRLTVVLVDDNSSDRTAAVAQEIAASLPPPKASLCIVKGELLPPGWVGKMWALSQGVPHATGDWLLFSDADILYPPGMVGALVSCARRNERDMVSLMAQLSTRFFWEKLLIPAFLYFFKLLYPFHAVNDPKRDTAAAAGGCIFIRKEALEAAGGIAAVRDALIDDIALARAVKSHKKNIMLLTAPDLLSRRTYTRLYEIWRMVTRSAFTELKYSYLRLIGCVLAMGFAFGVPLAALAAPLLCLQPSATTASWLTAATFAVAALASTAMILTYVPTVHHFGLKKVWSLTLPITALLYLAMTIDSARCYALGVRSAWKGRNYRTGK
jgi:hopene-associated glycosyltransferase HpnB